MGGHERDVVLLGKALSRNQWRGIVVVKQSRVRIMLKYIVIALVGLGIYIGVTYKDEIEDAMDARSFEEVHDVIEDASDKADDAKNDLTDKWEELTK